MAMAEDSELATFYNPEDPRKGLEKYLKDFKDDKKQLFLHIGICYLDNEDKHPGSHTLPKHGQLFILKNRLPDNAVLADRESHRVQHHLTVKEIMGQGRGPN